MSGKSCGINSIGERPQYMLGSNLYQRNNGNNTTAQLVSAIKQNKQDMRILQRKSFLAVIMVMSLKNCC